MAVLRKMSIIQYSARRARSDNNNNTTPCDFSSFTPASDSELLKILSNCLLPFRHVAVLTFAVLVCRRFDHKQTSSGHAHLDRQRFDIACLVNRERTSDIAVRREFKEGFLYGAYMPTVKMETRHPVDGYFRSEFPAICYYCGVMAA